MQNKLCEILDCFGYVQYLEVSSVTANKIKFRKAQMVIILGSNLMILFTIGKCFVIASLTAGNTLEKKLKKMKNNNLLTHVDIVNVL